MIPRALGRMQQVSRFAARRRSSSTLRGLKIPFSVRRCRFKSHPGHQRVGESRDQLVVADYPPMEIAAGYTDLNSMTSFKIGTFYSNAEIAKLGGGVQSFLAATKDGRVVAGRFHEDINPQLPTRLWVGGNKERLRTARLFRSQSDFIPVFVKPKKRRRGPKRWRFDGRWRVTNRTPHPTRDEEEARIVSETWNPNPAVSLVLHLEPEGAPNEEAFRAAENEAGNFNPTDVADARDRILSAIVQRRGQPEFRQRLLEAYGGQCAISDCDCVDVLEAAHIIPYQGECTNHVQNGLLLRGDIHTLFDLCKIAVDTGTWTLLVSDELKETVYRKLHGIQIKLPSDVSYRPSAEALDLHRRQAGLYQKRSQN